MNPLSTASTVDIGFIPHYHHLHHPSPQLAPTVAIQPHVPLPSPEGCGPSQLQSPEGSGRQEEQGGPKKWEAQAVRSEARQDESHVSFSPVFYLLPPLTALNPHDAHCWRTAVTTANQRPRRQLNRGVGNPTTTTTIPLLGWSTNNDDDASPTEGLGTLQ